MVVRAHVKRFMLAAGLALLSHSPAFALSVPSAEEQEVLIKNTLVTFNDANLTGNYSVLHAKAAKPFRDQISVDKLKQIFKGFVDGNVDISRAVGKPVKPTSAKIDDDVLILEGTIPITSDYVVNYTLKYMQSDAVWKMVGVNVKT